MKTSTLIFLFAFLFTAAEAQPWLRKNILSTDSSEDQRPLNFYEIKNNFELYWSDKEADEEHEEENAEEGGYQQFERWAHLMEPRVYPTGEFPDQGALMKAFNIEKQKSALRAGQGNQVATNSWSFVGPAVVPSNGGGSGRVNVIRFDPTNTNVMYVGAACGGVWKSTNGGTTWTSNTDFLNSISVADIAVNPRYPDSVYAATGDGWGYEVGSDFWGGLYTAGIVLSTDGGTTWNSIGVNYLQNNLNVIQRLLVNPSHPEILLAATRNGILRSVDAGLTWNTVRTGHFLDMEFNVVNDSVVYAVNGSALNRSTDAGATWSTLFSTFTSSDRLSLEVTPANSQVLYVMASSGQDLYKSSDGGVSFSQVTSPAGIGTFYGYYDNALAVSQTDENVLFTGGLDIYKSVNGGGSWATVSTWSNSTSSAYVHADQKTITFLPGSGSTVFATNDGGVFKTTNTGTAWSDLSGNMAIKQYYRMSSGNTDPYLMLAGAQDNGTDRLNTNVWRKIKGGDGMDCAIDPTDDTHSIASSQYGNFAVTFNNWTSNTTSSFPGGDWVTPVVFHPTNGNIVYAANTELYKSTDGGVTFNATSASLASDNITCIAVSTSNPQRIYVNNLSQAFRTSDGGVTWTSISAGLPGNAAFMWIAISDSDPDKIWIALSGYAAGQKVYRSNDGGATWTNVSGTLPNIPANAIAYQNNSNEGVYVGTDIGVYFRDNSMNDWIDFNQDLPKVIISELEINYTNNKLRAATYGRGIWEVDLQTSVSAANDAGMVNIISPQGIGCDSVFIPVVVIRNFGSANLTSVDVEYHVDANAVQTYSWTGNLAPNNNDTITLASITVTTGTHTFYVNTNNPNAVADLNTNNDATTSSFTVIENGAIALREGFESNALTTNKFLPVDPQNILSVTSAANGFGNSVYCMKANLFVNAASAEYLSPSLDFQNLVPPAKCDFNVASARNNNGYRDSVIVLVTTDCGITWTRVYAKGGNSLSTVSGVLTSSFTPTATQWRAESIDISAYIGQPDVQLKFILKGGANNVYLDDINIYDFLTSVNENVTASQFSIYPNPANDLLNVEYNGNKKDKIYFRLYDALGKMMAEKVLSAGQSRESILLNNLSSGVYVYSIASGNEIVLRSKLMVVH